MIDQNEFDRMLFDMLLECARPSWRFRLTFGKQERNLLQAAINTLRGQRQTNMLMNELDRRYRYRYANPPGEGVQQAHTASSPTPQ